VASAGPYETLHLALEIEITMPASHHSVFLQAGCPSCHPTNSIKALKAFYYVNSTHTHPFNSPFSGTTLVSQYQKGKTNLDFTEAGDSEWQWHQQICKSASRSRQITMPVPHHSSFLQAGCPSCRPTNSVKALKVFYYVNKFYYIIL